MSDSGDDWFEKDVDELANELKKKLEGKKSIHAPEKSIGSTSQQNSARPTFYSQILDGRSKYNLPNTTKAKISSPKKENIIKIKKPLLKLPSKEVRKRPDYEPLEAFYEEFEPNAELFGCCKDFRVQPRSSATRKRNQMKNKKRFSSKKLVEMIEQEPLEPKHTRKNRITTFDLFSFLVTDSRTKYKLPNTTKAKISSLKKENPKKIQKPLLKFPSKQVRKKPDYEPVEAFYEKFEPNAELFGCCKDFRVQPKSSATTKRNPMKNEKFVERFSSKKLMEIVKQEPLDVFLEIFQQDTKLFECLEHRIPEGYIEPMCLVFAKICELPFQSYIKDLLSKLLHSETIILQIKDFLTGPKASFEIVQKCLNIFWKAQSLGLRNAKLFNLLHSIGINYEKHFGLKSEIKDILEAFGDNYETFKEIYPIINDLRKTEWEDLKPNIVEGKYPSVQEYIHTHLSLLREDFVAPLRDIANAVINCLSIEELPRKNIYLRTRFLLTDAFKSKSGKGVSLLVDLKPGERENIVLNPNKQFKKLWVNPMLNLNGNLVCFTSGMEFSDLILAVVSEVQDKKTLDGYVHVEVLKMHNIGNIFNRDFLMLVSQVFFEPYHHVYRVLRGLREQNFPMKDYIVNVKRNMHPPDYMKGSTKLIYKYDNYCFNPLDSSSYPPREAMKLDQSQYSAFQNALSRKFSLIQGPPGTGKTYIGLKIVSTLLKNVDSRILIVCYTNHALDQFLEGILGTTTDIVRLGSQSKHKLLDKFNIKQIDSDKCRNLNACFYNAKQEYSKLMDEFEQLQKDNDDGTYKKVVETQMKLRKTSEKLDELKQIFSYKLIKNKKVIGMTTSYAARNNLLLELLKTPIVVIEGAAEVLEPHVVATLTQSTKHVILTGDHQQLRPATSVSRLSEKYNMDISLFERMIKNSMNCICLNTQYQMRPEIANLLRPTIYQDLQDAENVKVYENIRGMAKNMFFVNHNHKEKSKNEFITNSYEVGFLLALADYLIMQNYQPQDIAILSTYNAQMGTFLSQRIKYPRLKEVRIAVVDNFQGEESKIILLSLVRNNNDNRLGYLAMENRICVALSRAKEGFYVCGAIEFLASQNSTWENVRKTLEEQNSIGNGLPIVCQLHGNTVQVESVSDFKKVKSGKCCIVNRSKRK